MTRPRHIVPGAALRSETMSEIGGLLDVGVLTVDAGLVVVGWNEWLERATGKQSRDVVGRPLREVEPTLRPAAETAVNRAIHGSAVVMSQALHEYFLEARPPAGFEHMPRMQQSVRILPLSNDGQPLGAVAFIQDVTERVSREIELRAALEAAQAANEAKSNFFTAMSHELRTPIGAMSGYAELLATGIFGPISDQQREPLVRITTVASHLQHIVNEILSFARVGARREEVELSDVDAQVLAAEALIAVEPLAAQKKLAVRKRFPGGPIRLRTDQVKVRQILINLLGNAIKFTERGSIELEVSESEDGKMVSFSVLDTGSGIAPGNLGKIFEPFTRITRQGDRPNQGSGLGLAVSRGLARLLGGDLLVTSQLGVGSRFTATVPR